eukprot:12937501-Prorocentrum_lima.AAC.1
MQSSSRAVSPGINVVVARNAIHLLGARSRLSLRDFVAIVTITGPLVCAGVLPLVNNPRPTQPEPSRAPHTHRCRP